MRPGVHAAFVIAAALSAWISVNVAIWSSSESCRTNSDRFQCSEVLQALGVVGLFGSILALVVLLIWAAVKLLARALRRSVGTRDG